MKTDTGMLAATLAVQMARVGHNALHIGRSLGWGATRPVATEIAADAIAAADTFASAAGRMTEDRFRDMALPVVSKYRAGCTVEPGRFGIMFEAAAGYPSETVWVLERRRRRG